MPVATRNKPSWVMIVISTLLPTGAIIALSMPGGGCATPPSTAAVDPGEPPEGYASWDDYWADKDREYVDFERDRRRYQMERQRLPGGRP